MGDFRGTEQQTASAWKRRILLTGRKTDCLLLDHGSCDACSFTRVVPLVGSIPVLSGQGLSEGRKMAYPGSCGGHDGTFLGAAVSFQAIQ